MTKDEIKDLWDNYPYWNINENSDSNFGWGYTEKMVHIQALVNNNISKEIINNFIMEYPWFHLTENNYNILHCYHNYDKLSKEILDDILNKIKELSKK